jgi:hypothetical protein
MSKPDPPWDVREEPVERLELKVMCCGQDVVDVAAEAEIGHGVEVGLAVGGFLVGDPAAAVDDVCLELFYRYIPPLPPKRRPAPPPKP